MIATILAAVSLLGQLRFNINSITTDVVTDKENIELYSLISGKGKEGSIDMHELYLKVPVDDAEMAELKTLQAGDGSWKDINYADEKLSQWEPMVHADRFQRLAIRYARLSDREALKMALMSHDYWCRRNPICKNWWYNQIGCPKLLGAGFLLLADEMSPEQLKGAIWVMAHSKIGMTGQNLVNLAWNSIIRGILSNDEKLVREGRDAIAGELNISTGVEGLQPDWSYHQHGPQLQFGNYGMSYAVAMAWWCRALKGTELEFPREKMAALENFVRHGLSQVVWKGYFDFAACGRQIFPNTQRGKGLVVEVAMRNLGISVPAEGVHYYPYSDFGVFRTGEWYASIRMQSTRICGFETTNNENMKAYFSSDGELLVRRNGDEYSNLSAVWNWRLIPGATTYDDGSVLWGDRTGVWKKSEHWNAGDAFNHSSKVGGKVLDNGKYMVAAMEYIRDGLKAHKAWFFCENAIVCLGAGISKEGKGRVYTTVEQCNASGNAEITTRWVRHNGIVYVPMDGKVYVAAIKTQTGTWRDMAPYLPDEKVSADIFSMYLDHGENPKSDSYSYVVVPSSKSGEKAYRSVRKSVRILENKAERQSVKIGDRTLTVDWTGEELKFF